MKRKRDVESGEDTSSEEDNPNEDGWTRNVGWPNSLFIHWMPEETVNMEEDSISQAQIVNKL